MRLDVCGACFQDLGATGTAILQTTGEFAAVTPEAIDRHRAPAAPRSPVRPKSMTGDQTIACTWCGKTRDQVKKILSSNTAHLCSECVALCADILEAELGPDWR
jgi:hypothetical protein